MLNGLVAYISCVAQEKLPAATNVYNFEVEEFHNYFVGNHSILVHNMCAKSDEVHHIVEQCQRGKSGFTSAQIQSPSNKVTIPYDVHRRISGYYSSTPDFCAPLRVRDYLAGKSFEEQFRFGKKILKDIGGIILD